MEVSDYCMCACVNLPATCAAAWEQRAACLCQLVLQLHKILLRFCTFISSV